MVHTYNYEKMYIYKHKNCSKSAKLIFFQILKRWTSCHHHVKFQELWPDSLHTDKYEKMYIFKQKNCENYLNVNF